MHTKHPLRYAHVEGHTDICYSENGRHIITCGNDGDIRIWTGFEDPDPESYCVGEKCMCVSQKSDDIFVGRDDGRIIVLKYPEAERNGTLTRFTAPATQIVVSKNESTVVCISEDCKVKVFQSTEETNCVEFDNLRGPALGAAVSPNGELVAVSSGDGNIYVWKWSEKKLLKTIACVPTCNVFTSAKVLGRMSFDPTSKLLAYPDDKVITVVDTERFETKFTFSNKSEFSYSVVQFSSSGELIAASSTNGDLTIWNTATSEVTVFINYKYSICSMAWHPEEKGELSFCDVNGQFGTVEISETGKEQGNEISNNQTNDIDLETIDVADDDDDDENVISLEKLKAETLGLSASSPSIDLDLESNGVGSRAQSPERAKTPPVNLQPPFQPGSTPDYLPDRFMVYNDIGIVRHFRSEEEETSIDVTFHDASLFKSLYMKNVLNHSMASLSSSVLALACETPSKLVCIPLKAGVKEWTSELTELEEILCVAASTCLVAIATNVRMLRIYTIFGSQRAILSIPGPVVTIAAYKTHVFVAYHGCTTYSKDQNLFGMLVHLNGSEITNKVFPIPITPQSTLTWLGFTDAGSLATYDSLGLVRLCKVNSGAWIPVADTSLHAKGASDSFFLVSVSEKLETLRTIHCKGAIYPAAVPVPVSFELPMRVPFCEPDTDKTQMEDKMFRFSTFETEQPAKAFTETAIKLFALACRNNLDERAYELLEMLNSSQLVNLGLKYCNKLGKGRLVEKLTELQKKMQGEYVNNENKPNITVRPILNRRPKPKPQPTIESKPEENYSQELFADTTVLLSDSQIMTPETPKISNPSKRNPFAKKQTETKRNPLSLTNLENDCTFPEEVQVIKDDKPTHPNKIQKETFTTWFSSQKQKIETENPELSQEEVVKLGIKLFKKRKAEDDDSGQRTKQQKLSAFAFSK